MDPNFDSATRVMAHHSLARNKCCDMNCLVVKCFMPVDRTAPGHLYCSDSAVQPSVENFGILLTSARRTFEQVKSSQKDLKKSLMSKLSNKWIAPQAGSSSSNKGHWQYEVCTEAGTIIVCRAAFLAIYGFKKSTLEFAQSSLRLGNVPEAVDRENYDDVDFKSACEFFGFDYEQYLTDYENFIDFRHVSDTRQSLIATVFLMNYFSILGEKEPNSTEVHLDPIEKHEVYEEYIVELGLLEFDEVCLEQDAFFKLWKGAFPHVKIRQYKAVSGKCSTCERLKALAKTRKTKADRILVMRLRLLHRNQYMGEKLSYYARRLEAVNSNGKIWSFIFDGMSSGSTQLPYMGNMDDFGKQFSTHLQGCIAHAGNGTTFYWSYTNLMTGSSFNIHCILAALEDALSKGLPLPDEIYVQIDGGSENVAKCVYAALEHLIYKKLSKVILVTRLPVGHTHEDIDSRFGKIWRAFRNKSIYTPQQFEQVIKSAFSERSNVTVIPVVAILDYKDYYDKFIDPKLKNYAQEEWTQLQFKIEVNNVEGNNSIVLTNYKKFSQDIVCVLRQVNNIALSELDETDAEYTWCNYWPVILLSNFLPANAIESERSPGMSFLAQVPIGRPLPHKFKAWINSWEESMRAIVKRFPNKAEATIISDWMCFRNDVMPSKINPDTGEREPTEDINLYLESGGNLSAPLFDVLFNEGNNFPKYMRTLSSQSANAVLLLPSVSLQSSSLTTGFSGKNNLRATIFDLSLMEVMSQNTCSVECFSYPDRLRNWDFDHQHMYQRVLVKRGVGESRMNVIANIVAFCKYDCNEGDMYKITYDDKTKSGIMQGGDYEFARAAYLALFPEHENVKDLVLKVSHNRIMAIDIKKKKDAAARLQKQGGVQTLASGVISATTGARRENVGEISLPSWSEIAGTRPSGKETHLNPNPNPFVNLPSLQLISTTTKSTTKSNRTSKPQNTIPIPLPPISISVSLPLNANSYQAFQRNPNLTPLPPISVPIPLPVSSFPGSLPPISEPIAIVSSTSREDSSKNITKRIRYNTPNAGDLRLCSCGCNKLYENTIKCRGCNILYINKTCLNVISTWKCFECLPINS